MKKVIFALGALLAAMAAGFLVRAPDPVFSEARAQEPSTASCAALSAVTLRLGIGDQAPADWSGSAEGLVADGSDSWEAKSESSPLKLAGGRQSPRVLPALVSLSLPSSPCGSEPDEARSIRVHTGQGDFEFAPLELPLGTATPLLEGRVEVERIPSGLPTAVGDLDEDFPSCAALQDSSVLCAYVEYSLGRPIDEQAALAGDFSSIEFAGNGDRVAVVRRTGTRWSLPAYVTPPGRDVWRPVVTALSDGNAAILWSEQRNRNWDIYVREYRLASGVLSRARRLTTDPGADFNVAASGDCFAWQGRREGGFDVFAGRLGGRPVRASTSDASDWRPSVATDSAGSCWIAWDTYDAGNYDVYLRRFDDAQLGDPIAIAASRRFEARPSVAVDDRDRVWVAFEDSDEGWGKDAGDRWTGQQATPLYLNKNILVRVWDGTLRQTVTAPRAPTVDYHHDDTRIGTSQRHKISIPAMAFDGRGRPWLFFRKHPLQTGRGERWRSFGSYYDGGGWSRPIPLPLSDHLLDRRPGLATVGDGSLLAVFAGDRRQQARDRQDSDLYESTLLAEGRLNDPQLRAADPSLPRPASASVHPDEAEQIAEIRAERLEVGGKTLRFLRGEFHRHSAFSSHRDWDGPFEDVWRYGLDVAALDWIGPGDHDYAVGHDYLWWLQQKAADMYHATEDFSAVYTYERNVSYPSGHRNVMLPRRGIRPLPRMRGRDLVNGTEEDGSPDINNLYEYLRHFGGICSSHTSATNMGTDWRDGDMEVEPVVELFQGHRQSYEVSGGPFAATGADDTIQGYRPAGFIWEAFQKGRRLGFQASSDHVSTHISYGIVLAEENSREGIIEAFQRRHSYAAHDNIVLVVRSGDYLMGDEFSTEVVPRLRIQAAGTAPIDSIEIIRQVGMAKPAVVASMTPGIQDVDLGWSDPAAAAGEWNMYYVRLKQRNEALAWASPLWILYEPGNSD